MAPKISDLIPTQKTGLSYFGLCAHGLPALLVILLLILHLPNLKANNRDSTFNKKRFTVLTTALGVGYIGSMTGLSELWYKKNTRTSFHFFNDNDEWMQMDKVGHMTTSFHESRLIVESLRWTGLSDKKAIWFGSFAGLIFQGPIEIFDGYSSSYGASWGDELANLTGSVGVLSQYLLWNEIRITPKYSFHTTSYAALRPEVLGKNLSEQWLKDYNGQTYWLSFNISSFFKTQHKIPKWVNVSLGYGAQNMVFASRTANQASGHATYRQYYLSMDIDFSHVKVKSRFLKALLYPFNFIHIPFPALEYDERDGFKFHPVYF